MSSHFARLHAARIETTNFRRLNGSRCDPRLTTYHVASARNRSNSIFAAFNGISVTASA